MTAGTSELRRLIEPLRDHPGIRGPGRASERAVATRTAVFLPNVAETAAREEKLDPGLHRIILATGVRSVIAQPLVARGEVIGSMVFAVGDDRQYEPDDVERTAELARRVAPAIANTLSYAAEQRARRSADARAAELNAVIRAMGEGVFVCDAEGRIILANPAAENIFPDVEETTYAEILEQIEDPDRISPRLGQRGGPIELLAKGADDRWVELSTWPVAPEDQPAEGRHDETIVMLRDVTEQRQRQAVRDTFIGVLSHELRTPVTTIYAGSKVLSRSTELDEATQREIFDDIATEAERLHRLVEDVVAMTRFGEEAGELGTEPVLLQRILPTVIQSEENRWPEITFRLDVPAGVPTVIADPTYVEQVIRNLLSNAAKYGGRGTTVETRVEADGGEVRVLILDDGPGFPPDEAERLFELFFRSAQTARTAAGAGIGLFVCARLIRAMGGRIWATNRPERGSEFGFSLRVMTEDD
jgi:two-component system phosphate regulon sensor histidine kinase PhoR